MSEILRIQFVVPISPFEHPRAECNDVDDAVQLKRTAVQLVSAHLKADQFGSVPPIRDLRWKMQRKSRMGVRETN